MHLVGFTLNWLVAILFPVVLGLVLYRRLGVPGKLFFGGMAVFVASQVVHLPLNAGVAALFRSGALPTPSESVTAWLLPLGLGLSAGLCEETARAVGLIWVFERARSWAAGVLYGAGHGGVEALIVGVVALIGYINLIALRGMDASELEAMGLPAAKAVEVAAQVGSAWSMPVYKTILGAWERLCTVPVHIFLSVLVMRSVVRRQPVWWLAAIAAHTVLNAVAVVLIQAEELPLDPMLAAEVWITACGASAIAGILWMREDGEQEPEPARVPDPLRLERRPLDPDDLS